MIVIKMLAFEGCEKFANSFFFIPRNRLTARSTSFNLGFRRQQFKPEAIRGLYVRHLRRYTENVNQDTLKQQGWHYTTVER